MEGKGGEGGICRREERIEEFFFSDAACSSSIFCKSRLFDQGYVVYCAFYCDFQMYMLLGFYYNNKGVWQ